MKKIGLFYSFHTNKTAKVAEKITETFGDDAEVEPVNVEDSVTGDSLAEYDNLICGVSTWFDGELPNYWDEFIPDLEDTDLKGKKIALFGLGDQTSYPENFVDGIGLLGETLEECGAELVGFTSREGYEYESSKAERGDRFMGLVIDYENQAKMTDERIKKWVEQLKKEFN